MPGLLVVLALLAVGRWLGAAIVIGLFASFPFGSTAFATLGALGGSSPPIYVLFALLLLLTSMALHRGSLNELELFLPITGWLGLSLRSSRIA